MTCRGAIYAGAVPVIGCGWVGRAVRKSGDCVPFRRRALSTALYGNAAELDNKNVIPLGAATRLPSHRLSRLCVTKSLGLSSVGTLRKLPMYRLLVSGAENCQSHAELQPSETVAHPHSALDVARSWGVPCGLLAGRSTKSAKNPSDGPARAYRGHLLARYLPGLAHTLSHS